MHNKFSCVMSHLVGLDSDMISEILPGLGVEVLANRCINAQGSCRRQRRVQRARGSGKPIAPMLNFSVETFLILTTHVCSHIATCLETRCMCFRWACSWRESASCSTFCTRGEKMFNWLWLGPEKTAKVLTPSGCIQGKRKVWASVVA